MTSAIAKLFRDFATLRPASEPLSRPNPLEGKTVAIRRIWFYFWSSKLCYIEVGDFLGLGAFPACFLIKKFSVKHVFLNPEFDICLES